MKSFITTIFAFALFLYLPAWSHEADSEKKHEDHEEHEEGHHHEDEKNGHKDDHAHSENEGHEDVGGNVGPEKGILAADAEKGVTLSPEALKNFEIKTMTLSGAGPWNIPLSARLLSGEEVNIYRGRNNAFKRIDFKTTKTTETSLTITSSDLKAGDAIVIHGIGFLRIAELAAFGGAPEGHSH